MRFPIDIELGQFVGIVSISARAADVYSERVMLGTEPPLAGVNERVIRLAGVGSDVTELSMNRYGTHILSVYEEPQRFAAIIIHHTTIYFQES